MRDASIKVLTSTAAALLAFVLLTTASSLSTFWRIAAAGVSAAVVWGCAAYIGRVGERKRSIDFGAVASGIKGRNVNIRGVRARGPAAGRKTASDIRARRDVTVDDVEDTQK